MIKRRQFLDFFTKQNIQYASNNLSKPYLGNLSPGCVTCINGTWSCLYLNRLCTRNCFFCPTEQIEKNGKFPVPHDIRDVEFREVKEYIQYLETFPYDGIGISGGEPFLAFERLTEYISEIRNVFGSRHYIWMYTNGDLVTEERLAILEQIGLNEIRFDLSAREYNLTPVKLALKHIDTVTIEIPAIPEDVGKVKKLLKQFETLGVKYLILHQLMATEYNQNHFADRGYSFCKGIYRTSVPESELAAFDILKHAIESNSGVGINYCSLLYKERFQSNAFRRRYAPFCRSKEESITQTGFLRKFSFEDSIEDTFSPQQLESAIMAEPYRPIRVTYYYPKVQALTNEPDNASNVVSFGSNKAIISKSNATYFTLTNRVSALLFHNLFIENKENEIRALFRTEEVQSSDNFEFINNFYRQFENLEYLSRGLLDYEKGVPK
ncbi:MAG: radical SAM protein [Candidatus Methanoperedens sp.]|nr:radical SAM protein [Candidatus Methanoperedens sp.]